MRHMYHTLVSGMGIPALADVHKRSLITVEDLRTSTRGS